MVEADVLLDQPEAVRMLRDHAAGLSEPDPHKLAAHPGRRRQKCSLAFASQPR